MTFSARLAVIAQFARFLHLRFREDALGQVAGSLTFTTLLALVPLVTIVLTVISVFPVFGSFTGALKDFIVQNFVPGAATKLITVYMQEFAEKASRLTTLGVVLLLATSIMLMMTIDRAFNRIWRVERPRPLMQRLLVYWTALTVGPLLIGASLYVTSWAITASLGVMRQSAFEGVVFKFVAFALTCLALAFLYRALPNRKVSPLDAAIGGVLAGFAFEVMKSGFAYFLTQFFGNYKLVYGAFAGFPVFLIWVYSSWIVVLAGAVITAAIPFLRAGGWKISNIPGGRFIDALGLLKKLSEAHHRGSVMTVARLSRATRLQEADAERLLERMQQHRWVARSEEGWLLSRDTRAIPLSSVYREFVFRSDALRSEARVYGLEDTMLKMATGIESAGAMSLEDVFNTESIAPPSAQQGEGQGGKRRNLRGLG